MGRKKDQESVYWRIIFRKSINVLKKNNPGKNISKMIKMADDYMVSYEEIYPYTGLKNMRKFYQEKIFCGFSTESKTAIAFKKMNIRCHIIKMEKYKLENKNGNI